MNVDQKINALRPGGSVELSRCSGVAVRAERSGNGKILRIVRESGNTSTVIRTVKF